MKNARGELKAAIPDECSNYRPDKKRPTTVISDKSGVIYKCENYKKVPKSCGGCLGCYNWLKRGVFVNRNEDGFIRKIKNS